MPVAILITLLLNVIPGGSAPVLTDRAMELGIDFTHQAGNTGAYHFPEITGSGAGLVDIDDDGDLDAILIQAGAVGSTEPVRDSLFRNDMGRTGRFVDISEDWLPTRDGYGMGVAAGDVDGDGRVDFYVTSYGPNQLLINTGSRFVQRAADEPAQPDWSTSATFFDADRDGDLDLYIANYVVYDANANPSCYAEDSRRDYCGPNAFEGAPDRLLINDGDGEFRDRTLAWLPRHKPGAGLGVVAADFNADGWMDLYVANDGAANHLWINQQGQGFVDEALFSGVAMNASGRPEASMGIAVGDDDGDGDLDLFLTHLMGESNTLYRNDGTGNFVDVTARAGLAGPSMGYTGWGTAWVDLDQDNWLDLVVFNGAVRTIGPQRNAGSDWPFREANHVYLNQAGRRYVDISDQVGSDLLIAHSARGAAFGDVDQDGDPDMLINNGNGPAQLLFLAGSPTRWVGLDLGPTNVAMGAVVQLSTPERSITRRASGDGSYASAGDPRVVFYPGREPPFEIEIRWPNGQTSNHTIKAINRYVPIQRPAK